MRKLFSNNMVVWLQCGKFEYRISLNKTSFRIGTCLKLTHGVNQQIMAINAGVPHPNATYSLEVVRVEDDGREEKVLRRFV